MAKMLEADPKTVIDNVASTLEKDAEIKAPEWASFAKTGMHKQRQPVEENWWHIRAAAILRSVAKLGPIGTEKLRTKYGGKKNRGHKTEHHYKGSGSVARKILQQLEKAGYVRQTQKGTHKGRIITKKAADMLNKAGSEVTVVKAKADEAKPAKAPEKEAAK